MEKTSSFFKLNREELGVSEFGSKCLLQCLVSKIGLALSRARRSGTATKEIGFIVQYVPTFCIFLVLGTFIYIYSGRIRQDFLVNVPAMQPSNSLIQTYNLKTEDIIRKRTIAGVVLTGYSIVDVAGHLSSNQTCCFSASPCP